jgi:hypothetical protein
LEGSEEVVTVTRRPAGRTSLVERPRHKGWWGVDDYELEESAPQHEPAAPQREAPRQPAVKPDMDAIAAVGRALTPAQITAIHSVMRLFVDEDLQHGVDPGYTVHCHRCQARRPAIGSVNYSAATLCNACAVDYEILRARGLVDTVCDYIQR